MAQVTANDPGGVSIRRLLPAFVILPLLLGWLRLAGERAGVFDAATGTGMMMLLFIIIFSALTYHASRGASRSAEVLRESEERQRRLIENLKGSHFIYVHDTKGVFTHLSGSLTEILGYTPEEFKAHYSTYLTDHPANQAVHRHTERSIRGIPQPPYEVNVRHKEGSSRWLEVQEAPVATGKAAWSRWREWPRTSPSASGPRKPCARAKRNTARSSIRLMRAFALSK